MCHKSWLALLATQYFKVLAGESWGRNGSGNPDMKDECRGRQSLEIPGRSAK